MSTRTIIEINHDHLARLLEDVERKSGWRMSRLLRVLLGTEIVAELNEGRTPEPVPGIRILAQRHHSEGLTIVIR